MPNVTKLRQFKIPSTRIVDLEFIADNRESNTEFMESDLAASGLTPEDVEAVTHGKLGVPAHFVGGYILPYTDPDGDWVTNDQRELVMWRMKLQPEPGYSSSQKYDQPTKEQLAVYSIHGTPPYIPPHYHSMEKTDVLCICEGEKKAASVQKHLGVSAIGIGGCWNWRSGSSEGGVHDWILRVAANHQRIEIVPDGDYRRHDISKAYGTLCAELQAEFPELDISVVDVPGKVDDEIVRCGPEAQSWWEDLPRVGTDTLVEDPSSLAKRYGLGIRIMSNGSVKVNENTSNIQRLLVGHPAFGHIWRNLDTSQVFMGEEQFIYGVSEVEVANHFQHYLCMPSVKTGDVLRVVESLAGQNSKSPFLESINGVEWDGEQRLDTWLIRHLGADDNDYVREVSSKFLMASLKRQREPGCKMDWMLITTGPQGIGKSYCMDLLFHGLIVPVVGDNSAVAVAMKMHRGLCIILDEMDALNSRDIEFWKSMITTGTDVYRPPYGRAEISNPRSSVLYGTSNDDHFLINDATGMRRFKPVKVHTQMDFEAFKLEIPQLWAEAAARLNTGAETHVFTTPADMDTFVHHDDDMEIATEELRKVWNIPNSSLKVDGNIYITAGELKALLEPLIGRDYIGRGVKAKRLVNHMSRLGFKRRAGTCTKSGKSKPWVLLAEDAHHLLNG